MQMETSKMKIANPAEFLKPMVQTLPEHQKAFVLKMTTGLVRAQSVLLSEIGRSLGEGIPLIHTERRLSRNLSDRSLDFNEIHSRYLQQIRHWIGPTTLIPLDIGEITKVYAKHLAHLGWVRDGSCPRKDKLAQGWWLVEVEALNGEAHLPLQLELWSAKARGFRSRNTVVMNILDHLLTHLGNQGIYLADIGFDDDKFYTFFKQRECRYVIRCEGRRHVCPVSDPFRPRAVRNWMDFVPLSDLVWNWKMPQSKRTVEIRIGSAKVILANTREPVTLIVAKGLNQKGLFLLTSESIETPHQALKFVKAYLRRWGCEETARAYKQIFDLENIRVQSWRALQNMVRLVLLAWAFMCWLALKLPRPFLEAFLNSVQSFKPVRHIRFIYYRLARALRGRILPTPLEWSIRV